MAHPARSSKVRLDPRLSPLTNPATRCPGARQLYDQPSVVAATAFLKRWYFWATPRRLAPIIDAARTIKRHRNGILRWFDTKIANGLFEGLNSPSELQKPKPAATEPPETTQNSKEPFLFLLRWYRNAGNFHIDGAQVIAAGEI
jgi:Transposase